MNKFTFITLTLVSSLAFAKTVSVPNEVKVELRKYQDHGQGLSANAIQAFPLRVHQMILQRQNHFFEGLNGKCQDTIEITFGPQVMASEDESLRSFEAGLVRIEASKCYDNADPDELIQISASPEFKKKAFPTLRQITVENNLSCETTSAPSIGKSRYCYLSFDLEKSDLVSSQVNFLTFNDDDKSFDAPVYFREAFVSARRMGPQTLYYVLSYVRSTELSSFKKFFAKDYIAKVQKQVFTELENSRKK